MVSADEETIEDLLQDIPEDISVPAFRPDELNSCPACSRKNAPDKARCLYCGAELEIRPGVTRKLGDRRLEAWEKGFNTVAAGGKIRGNAASLAEELSLGQSVTDAISEGIFPVPVQRTETRAEAEFIQQKLRDQGIESLVVADEDLRLDTAPVRLRGLETSVGTMLLRLFNTATTRTIPVDQVAIIVAGSIVESKTQSTQKRTRRESEILDESEVSTKETVIDIYTIDDPTGFRIYPRGFDFSTLGSEKSLLAAENIRRLAVRLRSLVGEERFSDEYDTIRETLDSVWELETRTESLGLQKTGFGRPGIGKAATVSNAGQFTRYSRMRRHLL